jgi:CBS domain-containing protein
MIIEQLISPTVPTLTPADTGSRALFLMEENNYTQLPMIMEDQYMALIQEDDLMDWDKPESPLSAADFLEYRPAVFATGHPYDALKIAYQHNLSVVPVVDNANRYIGAITRDELLKFLAQSSGVETPGAIMVLETEPKNYSLYEIARICENEDIMVLSVRLYTNPQTGMLEITIKTNRTVLQGIAASFERQNYRIKNIYGEVDNNEDMLDRYHLLMTFINM